MKRALVSLGACLLVAGMAFQAGYVIAQESDLTATAYGTVNVRGGPGVQHEIVGQLAAGDHVPVNGRDEDGDWLRIVLDTGRNGWVASFAVLVEGGILELPVLTQTAGGSEDSVTITAYGSVNVRSGPGLDYPITAQLDAGDRLFVLGRSGEDNDWLYAQRTDIQGWVAYFTVTVDGDPAALPVLAVAGDGEAVVLENSVVRTNFNVRLRESPSLTDAVLEVVPYNRVVTPLARTSSGDWLYILHGKTSGWGLAQLFDITEEQMNWLPVYNAAVLPATPPPGGR